jgi:predicted metal-dependent hydrolase
VAPSRRALDHALDFARNEKDWIAGRLANVPPPILLDIGKRIPFRGEPHLVVASAAGRRPVQPDVEAGEPVLRVSGRAEHAPRRLQDYFKREVRRILEERTVQYAQAIGRKATRITVRDTASRWGSCSSTSSLSFSWRLIFAPDHVLDYVVAHEVAHLKEMNHGPRFWALVREMVADIEKPQAWLHDHGALLHRYAPKITR